MVQCMQIYVVWFWLIQVWFAHSMESWSGSFFNGQMNEPFPQNIAKIFKWSSYQYSNIIHVPRLCNCNAMTYYYFLGKVFVVGIRTISQSLLIWPVQSGTYLPVLTLIHHSSFPNIHIFSSCLFLLLIPFSWPLRFSLVNIKILSFCVSHFNPFQQMWLQGFKFWFTLSNRFLWKSCSNYCLPELNIGLWKWENKDYGMLEKH